ncbi:MULTISPECIES: 50S ribosomal protein L32 [Aquirufa]|jgi:large subunit ribosomal protein L32|uniref:Large ribosomal subunit protein bL32 n=5 Tax=Aquirufa TaxID=2676247 RepID=A0A2S2DSX2_9BACT|nr:MULTISPECIES: 50S ribosomal protein L32 [Aquirufa]AWL08493.1 50S ribosomal protein L32 [Aquirufa nivalisilvae]MBZ1325890.1 50S ribosomal protein L32 [Aquirufa aurantiipilula]MCZ2471580.1 50S ribosomal protein L32 [Aquirufa ecclesiirivi]MCZ2476400.1 50S ribosomal protein L32 [Aquirufa ecclesiirivi]MCZ2478963.1 50S ribosomal protein L32 [Aquirufa nivalisilvae]
MAHPKRKISTTRRDKRRSHDFSTPRQLSVDSQTGETHLFHRAHVHEGNLFYKGKMIVEGYSS